MSKGRHKDHFQHLKRGEDKACSNCGKVTYKVRGDIAKNKSGMFFCSIQCRKEFNKAQKTIMQCQNCKKQFEGSFYGQKAKWCSKRCSWEAKKEQTYARRKERRKNDPELVLKQREYFREYRKKNHAKSLERDASQRKKHKQAIKEQHDKWLKNNRDRRKLHVDKYNKKRLSTPLGRFESACRSRVYEAFKSKQLKKNKKTEELLGTTFDKALLHMESKFKEGMSWSNYGKGEGKWVIDHIVPLSLAEAEEEISSLCHFTNLQPLWEEENNHGGKGAKLILSMISYENKIKYKDIISRALKA